MDLVELCDDVAERLWLIDLGGQSALQSRGQQGCADAFAANVGGDQGMAAIIEIKLIDKSYRQIQQCVGLPHVVASKSNDSIYLSW